MYKVSETVLPIYISGQCPIIKTCSDVTLNLSSKDSTCTQFNNNKMSKPENSRKRSKNFDNFEREVLLEAAIEKKEIIDSKFTNQITNVKKKTKYG